jgi:AcrR family transcriptional regulator
VSINAAKSAPRSSYHHGDLQWALIESAIKLVRKEGPARLSLRAVAADVGVSPSAVYHYFPDKDALVTGVAHELFAQLFAIQQSALLKVSGNSAKAAKDKFRALGHSYFEWAHRDPNLFRLMFGGFCAVDRNKDPEHDPAFQMLQSALDELLTYGVIEKKARKDAEIFVWAAVHGATNLIIEGAMPAQAYEVILDSIETSLGMKSVVRVVK